MKLPDWLTARSQRSERAATGYTSIRITNATRARLAELQRRYPLAQGVDELLWHLIGEEIGPRTVTAYSDRPPAPLRSRSQASAPESGPASDRGRAPE